MDKDLLYRFFEGHASLEDMKVVKEWAGASEENAGLLRMERKLFNAMILAGHSRRVECEPCVEYDHEEQEELFYQGIPENSFCNSDNGECDGCIIFNR